MHHVKIFSCWGSENIHNLEIEVNDFINRQQVQVISQACTSSVSQTGSVFFAITLVFS